MVTKIFGLLRGQGFIRYLKNTSWMMLEQLLRIIAGLFVGIWVARYLGPQQFGLFSYAIAFTAIFAGVAKLGLDGIIVRELINHPEKKDLYLGTAFWLKVIGAIIVIALIAVIVPFTNNDAMTNIFIFIIAGGVVFQSFEVVEFYFQSQVLAKIVSICKIIQLTLSSLIKIYLVINEAELIAFVLITIFDVISLAICYFIAYKLQERDSFYRQFDRTVAKRFIKDSWPLILSSVVVMVYMRIDQVMIKEMLGEYEVGIYSAAVRLSEAFYFIPMLITASIFPAILNARKHNQELYRQRLQRLYTFLVWLALSLALITTFLSEWLILSLFGEMYQSASQVLIVHVWSAVFVFLGVAFSKYLIVENLTKLDFQRTLLGAISNVIFNLLLIPAYGVVGAAIATLLAQIITNLMYDLFDRRLHCQLKMKIKALFMPWLFLVR
ncbi:flippase [Vibrio vulnificus]|nr:flippase [Vibrio vulnificus]